MSRKNTKLLTVLFILLAASFLLFARSPLVSSLKFTVVDLTSLPMRIVAFPFLELKKILYYHRTFDEYIRLRDEAGMLRARLAGMDEVLLQNTRLEKLLNFKRRLVYRSVAANVIARDPSNWNAAVIIDKGRNHGVDVGMAVTDPSGVVGKVSEVTGNKAKVILISDPSFSVAAVVKRSREAGLVSGTLEGLCRMRYLSLESDVQPGDEVISSALSSSFPEGLLLGEVISVETGENNPSLNCIIKPVAPLSQLEEVLVILSQ